MKKFLFIFILVLSLVLPGARNVYAAEYEYSDIASQFNDKFEEFYPDVNLSDYLYYADFFISTDSSTPRNTWFRAYSNEFLSLNRTSEEWQRLVCSNMDNVLCVYYDFYPFDNGTDEWKSTSGTFGIKDNRDYIVASNYDIYDDSGTLVFQKPSDPLGIPREILIQVITQENPLKEILKLLPMAIPCLVGFVALRKALRTLETILKTA